LRNPGKTGEEEGGRRIRREEGLLKIKK